MTRISIGKNLRRLRLEKGLTQEQLADIFNVSAQAVSRWENDSACPDVTLLPGLAMYYGVTIDEIMGMERVREENQLLSVISEALAAAQADQPGESVRILRAALRTYPDNQTLLLLLGESLARQKDDPAALSEAIRIDERLLEKDEISMKARSTTMVNLIFLYVRAGLSDKADALVRQLPHLWESRELVSPETADSAQYRSALSASIRKALVFLCQKIDAAPHRLPGQTPNYIQQGADFTTKATDDQLLEKIQAFLANRNPS